MINIEKIDTTSKKQVNEFVEFPFKIYEGVEQWVPPFLPISKLC